MKITNRNQKITSRDSLLPGTVFKWGGKIYIRCGHGADLCLSENRMCEFTGSTDVTPIEAELIIND